MDEIPLIYRLGVALALGLLIGAERHWRERGEKAGQRTAGVRTFAITGLLGGLTAALASDATGGAGLNGTLFGLGFIAFSGAFTFFKWKEAEADRSFSVTTVIVGQTTFSLGALAVLGHLQVAGAAAVAIAAILASRELLHGFLQRVTWTELRSTLLLLSMTFVALPLVPDQPIEQLGGLNPSRIWLLAVILAAVSFAGYVAVKIFGVRRGRLIAGIAGGLASSTAVTVATARAASSGHATRPLASSALAASAVSCLRTLGLVWVAAPALALPLLPALAAGGLVFIAAAVLLAWHLAPSKAEDPEASNPFDFVSVLQTAALLAAVELIGKLATEKFGGAGAFVVAALSGLADVDAVTLGMTALVPETLSPMTASIAIAIAVASNTLAKSVYAFMLGGLAFGLAIGAGSLAALAAAAIVFLTLAGF